MAEGVVLKFGEILMKRVRDETIADWDMAADGRMRDAASQRLVAELNRLGPAAQLLLRELVPQIVDSALHHLLWTFEEETSIQVLVEDQNGDYINIADASDGLAGDLYDWVPRFSKQRFRNPADSV